MASRQEQRAPRPREDFGGLPYNITLPAVEQAYNLVDLLRRGAQVAADLAQLLDRSSAPPVSELEGQKVHRRDLSGEGLRGGHPDLGTGLRQEHGIGLPRDERALRVSHRDHAPPKILCLLYRR